MLRAGLDSRHALFVLYGISASLACLALAVRTASPNVRWGVLAGLLVAGFVAQRILERRVVARERAHVDVRSGA